mmetsp:Transcript_1824/g.2643  ORF Transcript_1824/g.2643 Transcript_1824/m.2643 type:complete len:851 (+) Transcript_1824:142-2694(+)|eukprot:CAMPEP_0203686702 /NCGR_PEP_ID=MMETSP0090-20130426/49198_1 /ASSEMBLY_ACC=CAM_ASM_001088 /TAXON_ID=426623 /ORGANISM="Chaetoceros affinis, Strain CCMP159" /LENGTH=850 /DNA_ID=CAMNT_0050555933 /DNA_START=98 /DNA_END=2650 /DNA_ORIENTATION=-
MANEEVVELSIEETNKLRKELGLKPLKVSSSSSSTHDKSSAAPTSSANKSSDEINLSIEETNALRSKIGLPPLKVESSSNGESSGRKASEAIHAPASNTREQDEVKRRIEEAKLKREVEAGVARMKNAAKNGSMTSTPDSQQGEGGTLSWVEKMRASRNKEQVDTDSYKDKKKSKKKQNKDKSKKGRNGVSDHNDVKMKEYTSNDLKDQNLNVTHSSADFEAGTTTILTLADKSILDADDEDDNGHTLENVNMSESATAKDNLKKKRMIEMGVGHAGGYAGYDDDEFEEMGGSQLSLGMNNKSAGVGGNGATKRRKGFKIGDSVNGASKDPSEDKADLFASFSGNSVSLVSSKTSTSRQADFMTYEEEESMGINNLNKKDMEKRRKKKEKKLMKKLRKKDKDSNKDKGQAAEKSKKVPDAEVKKGNSLLDDLEGSISKSIDGNKSHRKRKRLRVMSSDSENENEEHPNNEKQETEGEDEVIQNERKKKFNMIMEKGNTRTNKVFNEIKKESSDSSKRDASFEDDGKDDDAFLLAAVAKARRLNRLRSLNAKSIDGKRDATSSKSESSVSKGANAVVESIRCMRQKMPNNEAKNDKADNGRITFALDATKEFTRALRSQESKVAKPTEKVRESVHDVSQDVTPPSTDNTSQLDSTKLSNESDDSGKDEPTSLEELAGEVKEDHQEAVGGFGDTGSTVPVGRGLSSFLSMLKHTGDITGKNAGKEELRGRAKDERNYEDYAKLNLKDVVKLDTSGVGGARHEKDIEFANREIKLEYRDEHGRLLTRKEAYRNLCYQFHGHGSSKKNEEKRLKQVERERKEASLAARHDNSGTLGALKATQRATGKAFVLHKT